MAKNKPQNKELKFDKPEFVKIPEGDNIEIVMNGVDYIVTNEIANILINLSNKAKLK